MKRFKFLIGGVFLLLLVAPSWGNLNIKVAVDNLNFTLNSMAIRIREGRGLDLNHSGQCSSNVSFKDFDGKSVSYKLENNAVQRDIDGSGFTPLTSNQVVIEDLQFCPVEQGRCGRDDSCKKTVAIYLIGTVNKNGKGETTLRLQTTVAQRNK